MALVQLVQQLISVLVFPWGGLAAVLRREGCQTSKAASGNQRQTWHLSLLSRYIITGVRSAAAPAGRSDCAAWSEMAAR